MRKSFFRLAAFLAALYMIMCTAASALADPAVDDARKLLEKSVTIVEIDQELTRLQASEAETTAKLEETNVGIAEKTEQVRAKREHAGNVLRAYYMGERDHLWLLLLTSSSWEEAFAVLDFIEAVLSQDQRLLDAYRVAAEQLKAAASDLQRLKDDIASVRDRLLSERARLVALQSEVKETLAALPDAERKEQEDRVKRFTDQWQQEGKPLFERYFQALSDASQAFPDMIKKDKNSLKLDGLKLYVQLSDQQLNDFLSEKNELFRSFHFAFGKDEITAEGTSGSHKATVRGRYVLEKGIIRFHINSLTFNDIALPSETAKQLEDQYDLSFNPKLFMSSLTPTGVTTTSGKLVIEMKFG